MPSKREPKSLPRGPRRYGQLRLQYRHKPLLCGGLFVPASWTVQGCQPATLADRHDPEAGGVTYRMAVGFTETVYEVAYRAQPARGRLPRHPLIPDCERRYVGGVHHPAERDPPSGYVRL